MSPATTILHWILLILSIAALAYAGVLHARSWPYAPGNGAERMELAAQTATLVSIALGVLAGVLAL